MRDDSDDPEVREVNELGEIEQRRMSRLRADHILIAAGVILVLGGVLWALFR